MTPRSRLLRWRPWRFSLGMLLVVVTVLCWWLSHYSARLRHTRAVAQLRNQGMQVFGGCDHVTVEDMLYSDRTKGGAHWAISTIFDRRFRQGESASYFELDEKMRGGEGSLAVDSILICEAYSHLSRSWRRQAEEDFFLPGEYPSFWDHPLTAAELRPIRHLTKLRMASVTTDFATKPVTDELTRCKSLEILLLDMPKLPRAELEQWLELPRLRTLVLRSLTLRNPDLVAKFRRSRSLQQVVLVDCEISSAFMASMEREYPNLVLHYCHENGLPRHRLWPIEGWELSERLATEKQSAATALELPLPNVGELPKF